MLLKTVYSILTLSLLLSFESLCPIPVAWAVEKEPQGSVRELAADIEVFVRSGCPHCQDAKSFLVELQGDQPGLRVVFHDVEQSRQSMERLRSLTERTHVIMRVPAFYVRGQLIVGFQDATTTGVLIRSALGYQPLSPGADNDVPHSSCEVAENLSCGPDAASPAVAKTPEPFSVNLLGWRIGLEEAGLPLFTLALGLVDGFNPCSMWVLILMISLLAPLRSRARMLAIAGTFVVVEGIAYFAFMAAWLNLFLFIGVSRASEIVIAMIAILAGVVHLKDFWAFGWGVSLSIPAAAKPGIYARMRRVIQAENLPAAIIGVMVLAVLVQIVEFLCTSGLPALYTRILTLNQLGGLSFYGYILLYNLAYMFDDVAILAVGVITLSQRRLQENEGRWLKLLSGLVMLLLGFYLLLGAL